MSTEQQTTLNIIKTWFLHSPSHGIGRIGRAHTKGQFLFWSFIFVTFAGTMCGFIASVISKYIDQPTKINLDVRQYRDAIYFPAVTFCNINPLRSDRFLDKIKNSRPTSYDNRSMASDAEYKWKLAEYFHRLLSAHVNGSTHPFVEWGYRARDILVQCTFNGRICHSNLTSLFHPDYGNCYTFDNDIHVSDQRSNSTRYGWAIDDEQDGDDRYKLFFELFLHQQEYNIHLDDRAAFRLFIHRKQEVPILSQNSLFLAPNTFTKLIFSQRIVSFSEHCRTDLTEEMKKTFITSQVRYTQALCFKFCEQRFIAAHCQCTEQTLVIFFQFFNKNNTRKKTNTSRLCSFNDECLAVRKDFNSREFCPECLPECELIQYSIQPSYAEYPNIHGYDKVWRRVQNHFLHDNNVSAYLNSLKRQKNTRKNLVKENIVAVEVSASAYGTEILYESPMYTWTDVISSIGGQTGLWIGVSLMSFVEIGELIFLILSHLIRRAFNICVNRWKIFRGRFSIYEIKEQITKI